MALTKRTEISHRDVLADGQIQVQIDTIIEEDGVVLSCTHHRHVVAPGDDVSAEHPLVQRIAIAEHTAAVVQAYKGLLASQAELAS